MSEDISVIILTFNEEDNIAAALDSVIGWAKEVYVVDSYSTDKTVDIVLQRSEENVFIVQHEFIDYSKQWNWSLNNLPLQGRWTLKLDADERVNKTFKMEVKQLMANMESQVEGIYFRRKMFFMGRPIVHGGFSSTYVMHLWKTGAAHFEDRAVNEHPIVSGKTLKVASFIDHYDFKSLSNWIAKHNRYSSMEAIARIEGNSLGGVAPRLFGNPDERRIFYRKIYLNLPVKQVIYFLYRYIFQRGIFDGMGGFRYCLLHAFYRYWIDLKVREYHELGKYPEVTWPERGKPHPKIVDSELQKSVA